MFSFLKRTMKTLTVGKPLVPPVTLKDFNDLVYRVRILEVKLEQQSTIEKDKGKGPEK